MIVGCSGRRFTGRFRPRPELQSEKTTASLKQFLGGWAGGERSRIATGRMESALLGECHSGNWASYAMALQTRCFSP
ncbi:hypothetical protein SBA1_500038 [Candidatus Sulfotelmatobacter kueseliae]|uniref:Uncharacterized protein n=1 Tax=Candidatus Sulfotelmatobacter kueseliae TaxID=2042962 RepID=A0A2U3KWB0_9BACT|nr:hypothetical protein SBA1_500038 [Candidatus Sulfotelmatobacter kueseliae]